MLKKTFIKALGVSCAILSAQTVLALEPGAAPQAPAGNTMGIPLSVPLPPGLYYTSSAKFLRGSLKDNNGNDLGLDLNAPAITSIFLYTPGIQLFGADYRAWLAAPLIMATEKISNPMVGNLGEHSKTAFANLDFHFLDLSWVVGRGQFVSAGLGVLAPTGFFKQGSTSVSGHYWSINPRLGYTFMNPDWSITLESYYFKNFENDKTKYQSGDEFNFDATVLKKLDFINQGLQIGPVAYVREQVTSDENNGTAYYGTTNGKARQIGAGVQIVKDFGRGVFVGLSWTRDIETKNAVSNDGRIAFNVSAPIFSNPKKPAILPFNADQ